MKRLYRPLHDFSEWYLRRKIELLEKKLYIYPSDRNALKLSAKIDELKERLEENMNKKE